MTTSNASAGAANAQGASGGAAAGAGAGGGASGGNLDVTAGGASGGATGAGGASGSTTGDSKGGAGAAKLEVKWADGLLTPELQAKYAEKAQALGVDGKSAQGFADFYAELQATQRTADEAAVKAEVEGWRKAIREDAELGGANLETTRKNMESGAKQFASEGLQKLLRATGLGAHPEVVRHFAKLGALNKEDNVSGAAGGGAGETQEQRLARALYPSMVSQ